MDKLTSMKVFTAVAKLESFTGAAEELNVSKAMVSKHVRNLEDLLNVRFFDRTNRRVRLTEIGAAYRERCLRILSDIEETESAISDQNAQPQGTLKITAPTSFGTYHLVPAISDYKQLYPEVKVHLTLSEHSLDLVREGLDLAVRLGRLPDSSLIARKIASVRVLVCGASAYLERFGTPQQPGDLAQHNCLLYTQSIPKKDRWEFNGADGTFSVGVSGDFEATVSDAVRIAAVKGRGLAQLASYVVSGDLETGKLDALLTDYEPDELPIHALYPDRRHVSAALRTFVDYLQVRFHSQPYAANGSSADRIFPVTQGGS